MADGRSYVWKQTQFLHQSKSGCIHLLNHTRSCYSVEQPETKTMIKNIYSGEPQSSEKAARLQNPSKLVKKNTVIA